MKWSLACFWSSQQTSDVFTWWSSTYRYRPETCLAVIYPKLLGIKQVVTRVAGSVYLYWPQAINFHDMHTIFQCIPTRKINTARRAEIRRHLLENPGSCISVRKTNLEQPIHPNISLEFSVHSTEKDANSPEKQCPPEQLVLMHRKKQVHCLPGRLGVWRNWQTRQI